MAESTKAGWSKTYKGDLTLRETTLKKVTKLTVTWPNWQWHDLTDKRGLTNLSVRYPVSSQRGCW